MAGFAECARGSDKASRIQKYDGLPENGKLIDDGIRRQPQVVPVLGNFVSSLGQSIDLDNPILAATQFADSQSKPKFVAKITIADENSDDNF